MECSICNKLLRDKGNGTISSLRVDASSATVAGPPAPKRVKLQRGGCLMGVTYNAIHDQGQGAHLNSPLCGHVFHRVCILAWLKTGSKDCPFCKEYIISGTLKAIHLPVEDKTRHRCTRSCGGRLESHTKTLTEKKAKLQAEINVEKAGLEQAKQNFELEKKNIIGGFTAQVKKLTEDNAKLQKKMDEVLQTNAEESVQLEVVHKEKEKLEEDNIQLKKKLEGTVADKMKAELEFHHKQLTFQKDRQILNTRLECIKKDHEGLADELDRELQIKKKIMEGFTAQIKKLTEDNAELQKKMDEVLPTNAEDLKTSKIQLEGVHSEKAKLEEDNFQLKKQLEGATAAKMKAEMELHHKYLNFQTERQILNEQLESIKRDREGLEDELERELQIKQKMMEGFTAQIKKLTQDKEDLQKKLDSANKPTFDMDELFHTYVEEVKNLNVTVERVQNEKAKLEEDNQQLKKKMEGAVSTMKGVELELRQQQLSCEEVRQILDEAVSGVKRDHDVLQNELKAALSKQVLFEKQAKDLNERIEPMIKENTKLKGELLKEQSKVEGLTVKVGELEEQQNLLMNDYRARLNEEKEEMALRKAKIASLEESLAVVRRASSGVKQ